ncbi:MAG: delta-60 repeat domain-containing protein [Oceanipulchritudo sp.]
MKWNRLVLVAVWGCALAGWMELQAGESDLDLAFGDQGIAETTVGLTGNTPKDMAVQADGKILLAGLARDNQSSGTYGYDVGLVRFTADGLPDTTFSEDGKLMTDINSSGSTYTDDWGNAVVVQPDGKIVVAGASRQYTKTSSVIRFEWYQWDLMLLRYLPDGQLDTSFGEGGKVIHDINGAGNQPEGFNDVALQSDGKIIAVGYSRPGDNRFLVARFNIDGTLDTTFGAAGTGLVVEHFSINALEDAYSVAVLPDDSLVVAGRGVKGDGNNSLCLLKLTADGQLDTTFNSTGKLATTVGYSSYGSVAAVDPYGRILVAGYSVPSSGADQNILLMRMNADGTMDGTFASSGIFTTSLGDYRYQSVNGIVLSEDEKILLAARVKDPASIGLMRLNPDGSPDAEFGTEGAALHEIEGSTDLFVLGLAPAPQNKILVGAYLNYYENYTTIITFAVLRFGSSGLPWAWDEGYTELTDGWRSLDGFGRYAPTAGDWYWNPAHGHFSVLPGGSVDGLILFTTESGWIWTSGPISPWFYRFDTGEWEADP